MKASYAWLRSLVPGLKASPREVSDRLTAAGLEVEGLTEFGAASEKTIVARVVRYEPHPKRSKLRLVTVDRGSSEQTIVCGAPNVPDPGGLVALAPLGTFIPGLGVTLESRDIAGFQSEGMLCSEVELGLSAPSKSAGPDDHGPGILILPAGIAAPGTPLSQALPGSHDHVFEIGVTPNRPDALGHVGLARELAALYELPFALPAASKPKRDAVGELAKLVSITISDVERCPHYGAAMVQGVRVAPSPTWLRYRLESLGIRSISNVVDITNYVLLLFGHPIHGFDFNLVRGGRIDVRRARSGEMMTTLEGAERKLDPDDLVIADGEGAVALAGVMGGAGSEIRENTERVLIECAWFWPRGVRRSSRRHGLHTESSHRFERGVDPSDVHLVLEHTVGLLCELAEGTPVAGRILAGADLKAKPPVSLTQNRLDGLLGTHVALDRGASILKRLGFEVMRTGSDALQAVPPHHRPDIAGEADLIEEVIRVIGLDAVPTASSVIRGQRRGRTYAARRALRAAALELGLSEALTLAFTSRQALAAVGAPAPSVFLQNPLGDDRGVMRTSLLPGLLESARKANRRGVKTIRLFQIGPTFARTDATSKLPKEALVLTAVLAGQTEVRLDKPQPVDLYDAKGLAVELVERALRQPAQVVAFAEGTTPAHLHPRHAGALKIGEQQVATFGVLHPDVQDALELETGAVVVTVDVDTLETLGRTSTRYVPIPTVPAVERDIALVVHQKHEAGTVADAIRAAAGDLCESVTLFDVFQGQGIPDEHRSLAFRVIYRDPTSRTASDQARTLTEAEVEARHVIAREAVHSRFGAQLR